MTLWHLMTATAICGGVAAGFTARPYAGPLASCLTLAAGLAAGILALHLFRTLGDRLLASTERESIFVALYIGTFTGLIVVAAFGCWAGASLAHLLVH